MSAGDRTAAASSVLEIDSSAASLELDVAARVRAGARTVRFLGPVPLGTDAPLATLGAVRVLREAEAHGLPVRWLVQLGQGVDARLLLHLAPPDGVVDGATPPAVAEWRRRHRPGLCYYRLGPDFVFVKDVRRPGASARFRLDGVVTQFRSLEAVVDVAQVDTAAASLLGDLLEEGLALRLGNHATLLPSRMRRWPVPALDV